MKKSFILIITFAIVIHAGAVMARDFEFGSLLDIESVYEQDKVGTQIRPPMYLGVAVELMPDYEGSEDYDAIVYPVLRLDSQAGQYIEYRGHSFWLNAVPSRKFRAGPVLLYHFGRESVENDRVDALRDVEEALELGGFVGMRVDPWDVSFEIAKDVTDGHEGLSATLKGGYIQPINDRTTILLDALITYADDDYMESLFSIDLDNAARSGLRVYDAEGGIKDVGFGFAVSHTPFDRWHVMGFFGYSRLVGDAKDSPVVDDEGSADQFSSIVMVVFRF